MIMIISAHLHHPGYRFPLRQNLSEISRPQHVPVCQLLIFSNARPFCRKQIKYKLWAISIAHKTGNGRLSSQASPNKRLCIQISSFYILIINITFTSFYILHFDHKHQITSQSSPQRGCRKKSSWVRIIFYIVCRLYL